MTFNQNGDRQQIVRNQFFLGEQYPHGKLHLFHSFIGLPYKLQIWERLIELPIDYDAGDIRNEMVVSYDFTYNYYEVIEGEFQTFYGWRSEMGLDGKEIEAVEGDGFDFVYMNVPSNVKFNLGSEQKYIGQLQAKETDWNNVTCPRPESSQMYLGCV